MLRLRLRASVHSTDTNLFSSYPIRPLLVSQDAERREKIVDAVNRPQLTKHAGLAERFLQSPGGSEYERCNRMHVRMRIGLLGRLESPFGGFFAPIQAKKG